ALRAEFGPPGPEPPGDEVQRVLVGEADRPVRLVRDPRAEARGLAGADLRHRDLERGIAALPGAIHHVEGLLRGHAGGGGVAGEQGQVLLDGLERGERPAELPALGHVLHGLGEQELEAARHLGRAHQRAAHPHRPDAEPAAPPATRTIIGPSSPSATTTTCSARAPHGTRVARPESVSPAPRRSSVSRSPACAGATVIGPSGTSRPASARIAPASIVSASGTGAAKRPAAISTTKASDQEPPAPPRASGTCGRVRPFSSRACQSAAGHWPFSAASSTAVVA